MTAFRPRTANPSPRARLDGSTIITLCLLLALPGYALGRSATHFDWRVLIGMLFVSSVVAFLAYRRDKRCAEIGAWRVPEATLHLIALLGGWPGAFVAQRVYRHKTSKLSFQVVFWLIVLLHQYVAVDSVLDWRLTKEAIRVVNRG
jgi:uncharacterized membrane protein YsdA (DUF1294 family)